MKNNIFLFVVFALLAFSLGGCSATTKVTRVKTDQTIDLSGGWNDSDARMVAEEMIQNCLAHPWRDNFSKANNRNPTVIVGTVLNRSSEHIDPSVFIKDLEESLVNSGKVTFVVSKEERGDVRDERSDQQKGFTDPPTIKPFGKETGADYLLRGTMSTITDAAQGKSVTFYQVSLELVNLTNNQVEWIAKKELKKFIERSKYSL